MFGSVVLWLALLLPSSVVESGSLTSSGWASARLPSRGALSSSSLDRDARHATDAALDVSRDADAVGGEPGGLEPSAPEPRRLSTLRQGPPRNDGWVTDLGDLFDAGEERLLEGELDAYRAKTGHELAVLTVKSLDGGSIERFALETARAWKMGRVDVHDAALLVVARDERELRIEVGRGLEGELTDLECGVIIRKVIVPRFKQGDFFGGVRGGVQAMMESITPGAGGPQAAPPRRGPDAGQILTVFLAIGGLALFVIVRVATLRKHRPNALGRQLATEAAFDVLRVLAHFAAASGGGRGGRGGGFGGFGGGGGFSGGGASGRW
ncbi:MAG: TPM domain-containing protein [Planctomycetes bacterium]|nr:TPM domain-containing protein [Planctomycetota bacterium]